MPEPRDRLTILHVLRAPVGGLFRHVADLARGQAARGHRVGVIADATTGGAQGEAALADLAPDLALGLSRIAIGRHIGLRDIAAVRHVARRARDDAVQVLHGHGAKGGAFARLAPAGGAIRVYTPHGGSLHYAWTSAAGLLYLGLERILAPRTDLFLFESEYGRDAFARKIGRPAALVRVVHNGVGPEEFAPAADAPQASDLVFVGELRWLKGVDVLIDALAILRRDRPVSATIVGDGPDRTALEQRVASHRLGDAVRFAGRLPAHDAFARGRVVVVPSRAESLPYVVLEAAAAGRPLIATRVGGIAEILGDDAERLVAPGDPAALAAAIAACLDDEAGRCAAAARLQARVREHFSVAAMIDAVVAAYREALSRRS